MAINLLENMRLDGRVAWITGSSRGIGLACAQALHELGAKVVICYFSNQSSADVIVADLNLKRADSAFAVSLDVTSTISCESALKSILERWGRVDILVNAAGIIKDHLFIRLSDEAWQEVWNTNVMGSVRTARIVVREMMKNRWGRIVNLSSVAATKSGKGNANYAASKGAIESMTRTLACEVGSRGITVNCIAPGVILTDMSKELLEKGSEQLLDKQIIQRWGKPEEIAAWVALLCSSWGEYVTGQSFLVDGGLKLP